MPNQVRNLDSLKRKLSTLAQSGQFAPVLERALQTGGLRIAAEAKVRAPVLTGQLRRSIEVETEGGQRPRAVIGTNLEYAARQELGFSGQDSLGRIYSQAARPYLRPAFDQERDAAIQDVASAVEEQLRQIARS